MSTTETAQGRVRRARYENNRPEGYIPPINGAIFRKEDCGCEIVGDGNLPSPLLIDYCPAHFAICTKEAPA